MMLGQFINHNNQTTASNRCKDHPQFDIDTICFNLACRKNGKQIICSCCGEQQPHISHSHQLYPIYKTSPGFRIINGEKQLENLAILGQFKQFATQNIIQLQEFCLESIEKIVNKTCRKIQCLTDFFQKNAIFKICNKIRQNYGNHLECCVQMINNLKDFQERNNKFKVQAHQLIQNKIKHEQNFLINQIEFLKNGLESLFNNLSNKTSFLSTENKQSVCKRPINNKNFSLQLKNSEKIDKKRKIIDLEQQKFDRLSQLISEINHLESSELQGNQKILKSKSILNDNSLISNQTDRCSQFAEQNSFINNLLSFDEQLNKISKKDQKNPKILQNIQNQNQKPIGFDFQKQSTILIWNANNQAIQYLSNIAEVQHLIIQDKQISQSSLLYLIKKMTNLKGIHFNCEIQLSLKILKQLDIEYFSLFPSYKFIQINDRSKYFSKIQKTALDHIPQQLLRNLYSINSRIIKNRYICGQKIFQIKDFVSQVNFVQNQSDLYWVFPRGLHQKLLNVNYLLILVFSNILINKNVNLKQVYKKYSSLHTIVFDNCQASYDSLVQQFQHLTLYQLKHLQISGDFLDRKIELGIPAIEEIFSQKSLQTLILTNVSFKQDRCNKKLRITLYKIRNLYHLTYLNLFNSWPFKGRILSFLHKNCSQQLISLNIGCSRLKQEGFQEIIKFSKLESLSLDYTQINQSQLLEIMQALPCLKNLSIQNLNGSSMTRQTKKGRNSKVRYYGLIMPSFFKKLKRKILKFVNLYNCYSFSNYLWQGFNQLECIRVNEGLLTESTMNKLKQKGVKINVVQKDQFLQQITSNSFKLNHISLSDDEKSIKYKNQIDIKNDKREINQKNNQIELIKDRIDYSIQIQEEKSKQQMSNKDFSQDQCNQLREVRRRQLKKQLYKIESGQKIFAQTTQSIEY